MNLRTQLTGRIHLDNIREILHHTQESEQLREELYQLIFDADEAISYQALWVCTHFSAPDIQWLCQKQKDLIDEALVCPHTGRRRMLLSLICQQSLADPPRVDFLDFCLERMMSRQEPSSVQALCVKLAYQLTRSIPELQKELRALLEMMEPEMLSPALRATRKNILKAMKVRKNPLTL